MEKNVNNSLVFFIKKLKRPVFTTHELVLLSGKTASTVIQSLNYLQRQRIVSRVYRGIWVETETHDLSQYSLIPFLFPLNQAYVSFISALNLHGIIEQIPQEITLASISHSRKIKTKMGSFSIHQITPGFFDGFEWDKGSGNFLVAEPEKAFVDCLYLSSHKGQRFNYFPELYFSKKFSIKKVRYWIDKIPADRVRKSILTKLKKLTLPGRQNYFCKKFMHN